jgi:hypothetical protein
MSMFGIPGLGASFNYDEWLQRAHQQGQIAQSFNIGMLGYSPQWVDTMNRLEQHELKCRERAAEWRQSVSRHWLDAMIDVELWIWRP